MRGLQVPNAKGCMVANAHPELKEWCDAHPSPDLFQVAVAAALPVQPALEGPLRCGGASGKQAVCRRHRGGASSLWLGAVTPVNVVSGSSRTKQPVRS